MEITSNRKPCSYASRSTASMATSAFSTRFMAASACSSVSVPSWERSRRENDTLFCRQRSGRPCIRRTRSLLPAAFRQPVQWLLPFANRQCIVAQQAQVTGDCRELRQRLIGHFQLLPLQPFPVPAVLPHRFWCRCRRSSAPWGAVRPDSLPVFLRRE